MPNPRRGETEAELGGRRYTLCLTLGALAELEAAFGAEDLVALAERFERGRISARDAIRVLGAGLRGAGAEISDDEVARLAAPGGAAGYVRNVAELLAATFGTPPEEAEGRSTSPLPDGERSAAKRPGEGVQSEISCAVPPHPDPLPAALASASERPARPLKERRAGHSPSTGLVGAASGEREQEGWQRSANPPPPRA